MVNVNFSKNCHVNRGITIILKLLIYYDGFQNDIELEHTCKTFLKYTEILIITKYNYDEHNFRHGNQSE